MPVLNCPPTIRTLSYTPPTHTYTHTNGSSRESLDNPRRISLFSLGTLSVYRACRDELIKNGISEACDVIHDNCDDKISIKYLSRLRNKLEQDCID